MVIECFCAAVFVALYVSVYMVRKRHKKKMLPLDNCAWRDGKFLVICNPIGGRGGGKSIVDNIVKPMCKANGVNVEILYTERAMHAYEIGANHDFTSYCGVIIVSGDGLIHEFLNGVVIQLGGNIKSLTDLPPIGVIPGGTSNGIATSILSPSPHQAMIKVLQGCRNLVDIYHVMSVPKSGSSDKKDCNIDVWDMHYFSWAMVAEADDIMERKIRWIPKFLRETVSAIMVIAKKRTYNAALYLTPVTMDATARKIGRYSDPSLLPLVEKGRHAGSRLLEGKFIVLTAANMAHATYDVTMAPSVLPDDGTMDLLIMRGDVSRWLILWMFLNLNGKHLESSQVEMYKVSAFSLYPSNHAESYLDISGEWYPSCDITVEVHPRSAPFIY